MMFLTNNRTTADLVLSKRSTLIERFESGTVQQIPTGRARGTVLLGTGGLLAQLAAAVSFLLLWRGKVIAPSGSRLKNLLSPLRIPGISAAVYQAPSWHDNEECIVLDYSSTSFVAKKVRDEIREIAPGIFMGPVFLGKRHVLDFALDFTRKS
jgi:hypothetical protein